MKKPIILALGLLALSGLALSPSKALEAKAEDSLESVESVDSVESMESSDVSSEGSLDSSEASSESVESVSESASEEVPEPVSEFVCAIDSIAIKYRNSADDSYLSGGAEIGNYYLSADGWMADDENPIVMTIKGNVATKLESKAVYIYEYRPSLVMFAGSEVKQNEDKTYTLNRPEIDGKYDLSIYFTKTLIINPLELTQINWASFLTVQNMMTIGSWAVLVVGIIVLYAINMKYKKRGSTTLDEVKNSVNAKVEEVCGVETAKVLSEVMDKVVAKSFDSIENKLGKVDNNMSVLMRCLLVMQEGTPEARLAVTKYLSELDVSADEKAAQVKELIEGEMAKYKAEAEAKQKALEEAKKANAEWAEKVAEPKEEEDDGTRI